MENLVDSSKEMPIVDLETMTKLVGRILTIIDASIYGNQKEFIKDLIKQDCWEWYNRLPG